jgi:hypothetical protein
VTAPRLSLAVLLLAVGVCLARTGPLRSGPDLADFAAWDPAARRELRAGAALEARDREALRRMALKEAAVRRLIEGRAALPEVAAEFRSVSGNERYYWEYLERTYAGATAEERVCRNVIDYAEQALRSGPARQREAVLARLGAELSDHLRAVGVAPAPR